MTTLPVSSMAAFAVLPALGAAAAMLLGGLDVVVMRYDCAREVRQA